MRTTLSIALAVAAATGAAQAGDYDGSRPLICATMQAMDCARGEECVRGLPTDIGAPAFLRIDFQQKAVVGEKRTTPVQFMDTSNGQTLLQGNELGFGWTIAVDQESGAMSATLVDRDGVYVLFGACTTH